MWKTRKEVLATITRRVRNEFGKNRIMYEAYLGVDPLTGKVKRIYDTDPERIKQKVGDFYEEMGIDAGLSRVMNHEQIFDAKAAFAILEKHGINASLTEIAHFYIQYEEKRKAEEVENIPKILLVDAYNEYVKSFSDIQKAHAKSVMSRVGPFIASMPDGILANDVTPSHISSYLDSNPAWSKVTWNNAMTYIKSFFNWCSNPIRRYAVTNAASAFSKKKIAWQEPEYMRVAEVESLVRCVESTADRFPDMLAFFILSFFCGMRTAEIERMAADETAVTVTLEDETVRVAKPKGYQKGIRPRSFQISETALAWMKSFPFMGGVRKISSKTRRRIGFLAKQNGIRVPDNAGRHSFITYHVAAFGEPSKTEGIVGTSASRRCENYMGLVSRKEGTAYFSIMPSAVPPTA